MRALNLTPRLGFPTMPFRVLVTLFSIFLFAAAAGAQSLCGDCNSDGAVNVNDALMAAQFDAGVPGVNPGPCCDVYGPGTSGSNGSVDILDALLISQFSVGIVPSLHCACSDYGYAVGDDDTIFTYSLRPTVGQISTAAATPEAASTPGDRLLAVRRDLTQAWTTLNGAMATGYDTVTTDTETGVINNGGFINFPATAVLPDVSALAADEQTGGAQTFWAAHRTIPRLEYILGRNLQDREPTLDTLIELASVPSSPYLFGIGQAPLTQQGVPIYFIGPPTPPGCTILGPQVGSCGFVPLAPGFLPLSDVEATATGDAVFVSGPSPAALPTLHMFSPDPLAPTPTLATFPGAAPGGSLAIDTQGLRGWMAVGTSAIADFTYTPPTGGAAGTITPGVVTPIAGSIVEIAYNSASNTLSVAGTPNAGTITVYDVSSLTPPLTLIGSVTAPGAGVVVDSIATY